MGMFLQSRLTMYALISELEIDLRVLINDHLCPQVDESVLYDAELLQRLRARMQRDAAESTVDSQVRSLLGYTDFGDAIAILNKHRALLPKDVGVFISQHHSALESVIPVRNRVMHNRPLQYDDLPNIKALAKSLVSDKRAILEQLAKVVSRLESDPSFVLDLSIPQSDPVDSCEHNLPSPDFDETGFIGRTQQIEILHKHIRGPFPIISIVGVGGVGKTALALKVAYDLLDDERNLFDAIVWTTCKSATLTPHDIREIKGAISSSLGVLQAAAAELGVPSADPEREVLEYLSLFKVLLILDNMETVMDNRLREFLQKLPMGSKVIITSRVGLQEMEMRLRLEQMSEPESVQMLRALAKIRSTEQLVQTNNKNLGVYCRRLKDNPLAIKWFVSAVQAGLAPDSVLRDQGIVLDYCMDNVHKHLSEHARRVLSVFQVVAKELSPPEISILGSVEPALVRPTLLELESSNMIRMIHRPSGATFSTSYVLDPLAGAYLAKHHPVGQLELSDIKRQENKMRSVLETDAASRESDPFNVRTIAASSKEQRLAAVLLSQAVAKFFKDIKYIDECEELVSRAKALLPDFFEVHRVEAWLFARTRRTSEAKSAYLAAIELRPDYSPLRFFYGQFLLRSDDLEGGRRELSEALRLDPESASVQIELCRVELFEKKYAIALKALQELLDNRTGLPEIQYRLIHDTYLQCYSRQADDSRIARNPTDALTHVRSCRDAYERIPPRFIDHTTKKHIAKLVPVTAWCVSQLSGGNMREESVALHDWVHGVAEEAEGRRSDVPFLQSGLGASREVDFLSIGESREGTMDTVLQNYGFIWLGPKVQPNRIFVHRSEVRDYRWSEIRPGTPVRFRVGMNGGRIAALDVEIAD